MELVVIAAGNGSRFTKAGIQLPKPLVQYREKPLFWWATQSALSSNNFSRIHFAILRKHVVAEELDKKIKNLYPNAVLHIIDEITSGAAETAAIIANKLPINTPLAFVDCDVAFSFANKQPFDFLIASNSIAALCVFDSNNPEFSYVLYNEENEICGTIEKSVRSKSAICGLYGFKSAQIFLKNYIEYKKNCPYNELFLSGVFNILLAKKEKVCLIELSNHISLGTPSDLINARNIKKMDLPRWYLNK